MGMVSYSMKRDPGSKALPRLELVAQSAAVATVLIGCLGLSGWAFRSASLKSILPGLPVMVPGTAATFVLAGISLSILVRNRPGFAARIIGQTGGLMVALIG